MSEPSDRIAARTADVVSDLSGQLDAAEAAELAAEVEDRTRREAALVSVTDRLRASMLRTITVDTAAGPLTGGLRDVGSDWLRIEEGTGRSAIVPLAAVRSIAGLSRAAAPSATGALAGGLDLRTELRQIARDRTAIRIQLDHGRHVTGTVELVGADYVELTEQAPGERRSVGVERVGLVVRVAAMIAVRIG